VVMVEGMGAYLRSVGAGYSCLASFGTRISSAQRTRLSAAATLYYKVTGNLPQFIMGHDGDDPGRDAAFEAAIFFRSVAQCLVAEMPEGKDPEDLSVEELRKVYRGAVDVQSAMKTFLSGSARQVLMRQAKKKQKYRYRSEHERQPKKTSRILERIHSAGKARDSGEVQ